MIDIIIKSICCKDCECWGKISDTAEYAERPKTHANQCQVNQEGSTDKMEVDEVDEMCQRSESFYEMIYGKYMSNGNSETFKTILNAEPYENFTIQKKECTDHVQEKMRTRLINLKKLVKGLGGKGKLTGKPINELSMYSIEKMRNENTIRARLVKVVFMAKGNQRKAINTLST